MQVLILEVGERSYAPSTIWLHDGFWISRWVPDEVIRGAEHHALATLFPGIDSTVTLLKSSMMTKLVLALTMSW